MRHIAARTTTMRKLEIEQLRDRWQTPDGRRRAAQVIAALKKRCDLGSLGFLDRYDGRWDVRGIVLPSSQIVGTLKFEKYDFDRVARRFVVNRVRLVEVDLSFADLADSAWRRCGFENVRFDRTKFDGVGF